MFQSAAYGGGFASGPTLFANGSGGGDEPAGRDESQFSQEVRAILAPPMFAVVDPGGAQAGGGDAPPPQPVHSESESDAAVASSSTGAADKPPPPRILTLDEARQRYGLTIRNVVANFQVTRHVDLRTFALSTGNVEFKRGAGRVQMRFRRPDCHASVTAKGDVMIIGTTTEREARWAAVRIGRSVLRSQPDDKRPLRFLRYRISNMMACAYLPHGIKLDKMKQECNDKSMIYESEMDSGLLWRFADPKGSARVFTTGSVTILGANTVDKVLRILTVVAETVGRFTDGTRGKRDARAARAARIRFKDMDPCASENSDDDDELDDDDTDVIDRRRAKVPKVTERRFAEFTKADEWAANSDATGPAGEEDDEIDAELDARHKAAAAHTTWSRPAAVATSSCSSIADVVCAPADASATAAPPPVEERLSSDDDEDDFEDVV